MNSHRPDLPHDGVVIDEHEVDRRVIEPESFVADPSAFVDVRIERSVGKASYSMIGPGVSQNAEQTINLVEPHGFNVGAASMPAGVVNNPHLHYTAEVFLCTRGSWRMTLGEDGAQTLDVVEGTVFSAPSWVFRGFENVGDDDGWLFVVLGGDDTGGIVWAPEILREAAETGLHLTADNDVVEKADAVDREIVEPLSDDDLASVDSYTDDELAARAVAREDLAWSGQAMLSAVVSGHASELAPVLGYGMSADRHHLPPINGAHGFSIEWLRLPVGSSTGLHASGDTQVVIPISGAWEIAFNRPADEISRRPAVESVVSVPPDTWRDFRNVGDAPATAIVVNGGSSPTRLRWLPDMIAAAAQAGFGLDAGGHLAPAHLLGGRR